MTIFEFEFDRAILVLVEPSDGKRYATNTDSSRGRVS